MLAKGAREIGAIAARDDLPRRRIRCFGGRFEVAKCVEVVALEGLGPRQRFERLKPVMIEIRRPRKTTELTLDLGNRIGKIEFAR